MTDQELDALLYDAASRMREMDLAAQPKREDLPHYPTSHRFERRMARLIRRTQRPEWFNSALYSARRAAVIVLVLFTVSFSGLMVTSQAFRQQVMAAVMEVFEVITEFRFRYDPRYDDGRTAGDFELTYLPEGMVEVERAEDSTTCRVFYEDPAGATLEVSRFVLTEKSAHSYGLDTEDAEISYFTIRNSLAMAVSKGLDNTILWSEGNTTVILSGTIPMEELEQVALGLN